MKISDLKKYIRDIPNFPKEGIIFKDISTLLKDPEAFQKSIDTLAKAFKKARVCYVVGVEARGRSRARPRPGWRGIPRICAARRPCRAAWS